VPRAVPRAQAGAGGLAGDELLGPCARGDLELLEACLEVLEMEYGEQSFGMVAYAGAAGGKIRPDNWSAGLRRVRIGRHLATRFGSVSGAGDGFIAPGKPQQGSEASKAVGRGPSRDKDQELEGILQRTFCLLYRLVVVPRVESGLCHPAKRPEVGRDGFLLAQEMVKQAHVLFQRISLGHGAQGAAIGPCRVAAELVQSCASAVRMGSYSEAHKDLGALWASLRLRPRSTVTECLEVHPPAAQVLGFLLRSSARELLAGGPGGVSDPQALAMMLEVLDLCSEIARLSGLTRSAPAAPVRPAATLLGRAGPAERQRKQRGELAELGEGGPPGGRVLAVLHPRTAVLALAPVALLRDEVAGQLLRGVWGLLDACALPDTRRIRPALALLAQLLGIDPTPRGAVPPPSLPFSSAAIRAAVAVSLVDLESTISSKPACVRSASLYGVAFLVHRAVVVLQPAGAASVVDVVAAAEAGHQLQLGAMTASRRLFDAVRPHMSALFFEGSRGRQPARKLQIATDGRLAAQFRELQETGWFQAEGLWFEVLRAGDDSDADECSSRDSSIEALSPPGVVGP